MHFSWIDRFLAHRSEPCFGSERESVAAGGLADHVRLADAAHTTGGPGLRDADRDAKAVGEGFRGAENRSLPAAGALELTASLDAAQWKGG